MPFPSVEVSIMWNRKHVLALGLVCALLVFFSAPKVRGQAAYGTIIGTITDPTGAAVADAKVTVTDMEKGVSQEITTNSTGYYTANNLIPGNYKVNVEAKGFKSFLQQN